jgi:hypothetical protein
MKKQPYEIDCSFSQNDIDFFDIVIEEMKADNFGGFEKYTHEIALKTILIGTRLGRHYLPVKRAQETWETWSRRRSKMITEERRQEFLKQNGHEPMKFVIARLCGRTHLSFVQNNKLDGNRTWNKNPYQGKIFTSRKEALLFAQEEKFPANTFIFDLLNEVAFDISGAYSVRTDYPDDCLIENLTEEKVFRFRPRGA